MAAMNISLGVRPVGPELVVGVGDCRTTAFPVRTLATYALGSCIAVIGWDWKVRAGGLLHVMLPDSSMDRTGGGAVGNPFLYVDTGVPELLRRLEAMGAARTRLRWCMAGGANMMADSTSFEIGKRNHLALKRAFWKAGLFVDSEEVGGNDSRSVRLDLESGRVDLRRGVGSGRALMPGRMALNLERGSK